MNSGLLPRILVGAIVAGALLGALLAFDRPESFAATQTTDDAYVQADFTVIAPQVAGVISQVAVEDNQAVAAGAALVSIDDRKLTIAVDTAKATVDALQARLERQRNAIAQARAALATSSARLKFAASNRDRFANLARDGSGTVLARQEALMEWETQRAALERDRAGLSAARQQVTVLRAELDKARAAMADAELNLSYARMYAPVDGVVTHNKARVGAYARVGEPLLTLVPLDALYIEANFRETQMARIRVGQPVDITVDALPGVHLRGRVASLGPASGVSFSPIPPHNATGNFTKIVQRLPVRIEMERGQEDAGQLRVGMSVHPRIDVTAVPVD